MAESRIIILADEEYPGDACRLGNELQFSVYSEPPSDAEFALKFFSEGLGFLDLKHEERNPVIVDFCQGKAAYRRNQSEMIVKATGVGKIETARVVDATAGLGRDSFVLASRGCNVTLLERNPVIAALLADGLKRAQQNPSTAAIAARMTLYKTDAVKWLKNQQQHCDCILLDPMFPQRKKKAAVKKEMQIFQALLGTEENNHELLNAALTADSKRVVVKRPVKADFLNTRKPSFSVAGRSTRFDVYINPEK